jgi:hypothetical protein
MVNYENSMLCPLGCVRRKVQMFVHRGFRRAAAPVAHRACKAARCDRNSAAFGISDRPPIYIILPCMIRVNRRADSKSSLPWTSCSTSPMPLTFSTAPRPWSIVLEARSTGYRRYFWSLDARHAHLASVGPWPSPARVSYASQDRDLQSLHQRH